MACLFKLPFISQISVTGSCDASQTGEWYFWFDNPYIHFTKINVNNTYTFDDSDTKFTAIKALEHLQGDPERILGVDYAVGNNQMDRDCPCCRRGR